VSEPLVSVVTATYRRPRTVVERAVASVACQSYPAIEHIVVLDGPDEETEQALNRSGYLPRGPRRVVRLGRNWTVPFGNESNGAIARAAGGWLAAGKYVHWLDDDNIWQPQHVAEMVALAEDSGADLICSDFAAPGGMLGVWDKPRVGNVDSSSFMIRADCLAVSTWQPDGYTCDGFLAERLVAAGCSWVRKPGATMQITSQRFGAPD